MLNNHCVISAASLSGFGIYLLIAAVAVILFGVLYVRFTPYDEIALIKDNNTAAAVSFSGAMLAFCLPLYSVIHGAAGYVDLIIWALIALVLQLALFSLVRRVFPFVVSGITEGKLASAIFLAGLSLVTGLINAGCLS